MLISKYLRREAEPIFYLPREVPQTKPNQGWLLILVNRNGVESENKLCSDCKEASISFQPDLVCADIRYQHIFWPLIKEQDEWHIRSLLKGILLWKFQSHLARIYFQFGPDIFAEMHPILPLLMVLPSLNRWIHSPKSVGSTVLVNMWFCLLCFLEGSPLKPFHVFKSQERIFVAHFAIVINWPERE